MDITLLSSVVKSCCKLWSISGNPKWIKDIKKTKNFIVHSQINEITKSEFDQRFTLVEHYGVEYSKCCRSCISKNDQRGNFYFYK